MSKVIAVVQEKGGVSKTTTVKNLAAGLVARGYKVLAIDLDASANLAKSMGIRDEEDKTICRILDNFIEDDDFPDNAPDVILSSEEGFDIIAGSYDVHDYELILPSQMMKEIIIRNYIATLGNKYDYVLLDCQAGLGILTTNALFAADYLIVPISAEFLAIDAMQNLFKKIAKVRKANGTFTKPEVLGVLFTQVRANTRNNRDLMKMSRDQYGHNVNLFDNTIPLTTLIPESDAAGESVLKYAPHSIAALQYNNFIDECLALLKEKEGER